MTNAPIETAETVLIVEDDPLVRAYAVSCVESLGYQTIAAANGADAMTRLAEENKIDILFTDIVMPGTINGWELADQARANNAALRVLFTSGYALEALTSHNRLPEGAIFLSKPYRKTELAKRLLETLPS